MQIDILYEDSDLLVVNKPAGLVVHADGKREQETLRDWFVAQYPESQGVGEEPIKTQTGKLICRDGIVHRLDKDTSGAIILCKNQEIYEHIKAQFQNRSIQKVYHALVYGSPHFETRVVDQSIGRSKTFAKWTAIPKAMRGTSRDALTVFTLLKRGDDISYIEARPKTGRTHQIRVHLQFLNYPIVADGIYAGKRYTEDTSYGMSRQALHAHAITFMDRDNTEHTIEAPLPEDMRNLIKQI